MSREQVWKGFVRQKALYELLLPLVKKSRLLISAFSSFASKHVKQKSSTNPFYQVHRLVLSLAGLFRKLRPLFKTLVTAAVGWAWVGLITSLWLAARFCALLDQFFIAIEQRVHRKIQRSFFERFFLGFLNDDMIWLLVVNTRPWYLSSVFQNFICKHLITYLGFIQYIWRVRATSLGIFLWQSPKLLENGQKSLLKPTTYLL